LEKVTVRKHSLLGLSGKRLTKENCSSAKGIHPRQEKGILEISSKKSFACSRERLRGGNGGPFAERGRRHARTPTGRRGEKELTSSCQTVEGTEEKKKEEAIPQYLFRRGEK